MTEEKKGKVKELKQKLLNLSKEEREELNSRIGIVNIEGKSFSPSNTLLLHFQNPSSTIVGGYKQWKGASRQVRKGEHGYIIFFPVGEKNEEGEITKAEQFFMGTVFDITQTEEIAS